MTAAMASSRKLQYLVDQSQPQRLPGLSKPSGKQGVASLLNQEFQLAHWKV
ncbi:hypothetical protein NC651_024933 [Populus alba x Populus x berolinensis]|nr:hypothetical protein NC651_024933 [Populus alba x Populus x berolinensis]